MKCLRILKTEACHYGFTNFSNARGHYQDLIKQYRLSKDCGNQTSLVTSTSAGDKNPNDETVIDTSNEIIENAEEKTQYRQLAIIKKATDRRNGARKPKSKERNRATTERAPVGVRAGA